MARGGLLDDVVPKKKWSFFGKRFYSTESPTYVDRLQVFMNGTESAILTGRLLTIFLAWRELSEPNHNT